VYDEITTEVAVEILTLAATTDKLLPFLVDPSLVDQYVEIWEGVSAAPRSQQVTHLLELIRHHQTQEDIRNADVLISRLKHTREWSGLHSDNIKPIVHTLLSCIM